MSHRHRFVESETTSNFDGNFHHRGHAQPEHFDSYRMAPSGRRQHHEVAFLPHLSFSDHRADWGGHREYVGRPHRRGHGHGRHESFEPYPHHDHGHRGGHHHQHRHLDHLRHPSHEQRHRIQEHFTGRRGHGGLHRGLDRRSDRSQETPESSGLGKAFSDVGHFMANLAHKVASGIGTVGDCAKGPRLTFKALGLELPPMIATEQGKWVEKSGLFDRVSRDDVRPGDYGVRDWNHRLAQAKGINKGDSFIVHGVGRDGQLYGSNDHHFAVPEDGGRYINTKFFRPNAKFWELYGDKLPKSIQNRT